MVLSLHVACLQTSPAADFGAALEQALAERVAEDGAELIALPEYCGGLRSDDGAIRARYDKIHLFDVDLGAGERCHESDLVALGDVAVPVETLWGVLGLSIWYDLRFPDLYRRLAPAGGEILCIPTAFTRTTGAAHWHVLNRARAIENGAFVIAPFAVGPAYGGGETYGHSLIVDPWGDVVADGGTEPGLVSARIDLDLVAETRRRISSLNHGRPFGDGTARRSVA